MERTSVLVLVLEDLMDLHKGTPLQLLQWDIDLDHHDIEWFALEMNRDHSVVLEIASRCCISDPFVDYDGYSVSSKGFLPTMLDTMAI